MSEDLLQGLRDAVADADPEGEVDPKATLDELLKTLENLPGLTAEDKESLLRSLAGGGPQPPIGGTVSNPWVEFLILFGLVTLVILLLGFIGYRLYENMVTREKLKELKKLRKEQKKKR